MLGRANGQALGARPRTGRAVVLASLLLPLAVACGSGGGGGGASEEPEVTSPVLLSGPEETVSTPGGNVLLHFTREGVDAVSDEFVRWGREALDLAWGEFVDEIGWRRPPADGKIGGDSRYDVWLESFYNAGMGSVSRGYTYPNSDGKSYIIVNSDMQPGANPAHHPLSLTYSEAFVRSVFAHELVHACQVAYEGGIDLGNAASEFFAENTASYHGADLFGIFESDLPKDVLIVQTLLLARLGQPRLSLHNAEMERHYVPIWSKYLVDSRGGDRTIPRRIYEEVERDPGAGMFEAMDRVLRATGGDLATDYQTYAEWNYRIGPYADGTGYEGADGYSTTWGSVNVTFDVGPPPVEGSSGASSPSPLGSNYIRFEPDPGSPDGTFRLTGQLGVEWAVSILARDASTGVYEVTRQFVGPLRTEVSIPIPGWNAKDDLVAVVSNLNVAAEPDQNVGRYRYSIAASDS